ncbi:MAG TPA: hypothetical protein VM097_11975 [Mycobacteriales bacterium]|nr:hypothetical protein [Mycobacteriales bacterium]
MGQRVILFKTLPSGDYLDQMIRDGVLRAAMTFLPGGCYAGAGIYPETIAYRSSTSQSTDAVAASACPYEDPVQCKEWEILEILRKVSFGVPQAFNAFVFVEIRAGFRAEWERHVVEALQELEVDVNADADQEYFAAAHLVGCGSYNAMFELLTSDHERLQRCILRLTDLEYVEDVMVGHLAADDAKGFGDPEAEAAPQ